MLPPRPVADDPDRNPHLASALRGAEARVPPERVAEVTVFPRRAAGSRETGLAVLAAYAGAEGGGERRTIWTVRYEAVQQRGGRTARTEDVAEQGTVPVDRVARIVEGVVRRLDDAAQAGPQPTPHAIDGDPARWAALLADLGAGDA